MKDAAALSVREFGAGAEPVLALHCGLGTSGMWKDVVARLGDTTVTAPDLPGHGRSGSFPDGVDVHDAACDAVRPLMDRPMHLVGHSFGATVALRLAQDTPGHVLSLTLIEPVFFAAAADGPVKSAHYEREAAHFAGFERGDLMGTAQGFNSVWGGGAPWESFPERARKLMASQMPFVIGTEPSLWRDIHGMLHPDRMARLSMPVSLVRGGDTVPIIAEIHRGLLSRLSHGREAVIPGAGHMLVMTHADDVARQIRSTMAEAKARSAVTPR